MVLYVIFVMFEASAINDGSRIYQTRIGDHRKDHLGPWNRMTMYIAQVWSDIIPSHRTREHAV